jgi:hypothetical protein
MPIVVVFFNLVVIHANLEPVLVPRLDIWPVQPVWPIDALLVGSSKADPRMPKVACQGSNKCQLSSSRKYLNHRESIEDDNCVAIGLDYAYLFILWSRQTDTRDNKGTADVAEP